MTQLAIAGGNPVRDALLPYGRQSIDEDDVARVIEALRSQWLTTGPLVAEFESAFARITGATHAVAVSNGTAALHAMVAGLDIGPGDEVIVPSMTFVATANCAVFQGATVVFADVDSHTLLLDIENVAQCLSVRTKAIIAVDYAGQPADYTALRELGERAGVVVLADACHSLGASDNSQAVGTLAAMSAFSLHPVKPITSGEGGMVTTNDALLAQRLRRFRSHGINGDPRQREKQGTWFYEMVELGYNYRLTDIQCALGLSQLHKLPSWIKRRQYLANLYDQAFSELVEVIPLARRPDTSHAFHLYVLRFDLARLRADRAQIFAALRAEGIGVNVHYLPVHLHPFYRFRFGSGPGLCPVAEAAYEQIITLPLFPAMTDRDAQDVVDAVYKVIKAYRR